MNETLYTIGETAKLCSLSESQLRNYDKIGLLSPEVRGENNYRYYTQMQLEQILIIKELKGYGVSLSMIKELLDDQSPDMLFQVLEGMLMQKRDELHRQLKKYDAILDRLLMLSNARKARDIHEGLGGKITDGFSIVAIAERPIISIRRKSKSYKTHHYTDRYLELQSLIESKGVSTGRSWFILYHEHYECIFDRGEDAMGDMEFFVNVATGDATAYTRLFGGFQAACATYLGAYSDDRHKETYDALADWTKAMGHKTTGISYQELLVGRNATDDEEQFITKIYLPLDVNSI